MSKVVEEIKPSIVVSKWHVHLYATSSQFLRHIKSSQIVDAIQIILSIHNH